MLVRVSITSDHGVTEVRINESIELSKEKSRGCKTMRGHGKVYQLHQIEVVDGYVVHDHLAEHLVHVGMI